MKELIKRGGNFVRTNPTIISSILLIFIVVGALFLNSYVTLSRFQANLDKTLRTKALLAENVLSVASQDQFNNLPATSDRLQAYIAEIKKRDSEIAEITIYAPDQHNNFLPLVSSEDLRLLETQDVLLKQIGANARKYALAVDDAFAYLSSDNGQRFWNVVKATKAADGRTTGILHLRLSLVDSDALTEKTIQQVYLLSLGAMLIVLLLVFNHLRLFAFEVQAKKLEELDKMKDDFIAMASHELKSPLTAISGYAELLNDTVKKGEQHELIAQQKKYLHNIDISVERLKNLVEDLLVVSRLEQNRLPVQCGPLDMVPLVAEIVSEMSVMADQKGLKLKNEQPVSSKVWADSERVKQILVNLISNAIKYTPQGTVELLVKEDTGFVYLTVADTGLGISADEMQKLFSKFYRVQNSQTAQIVGTGLGLWIAREVAQKMGGNITVESIEGVGSHFTLKLKKA